MDIINPSLSVQRLQHELWELTVRYTIIFTVQELNPPFDFAFLDAVRIWEWDRHDHDAVTTPHRIVIVTIRCATPRPATLPKSRACM